MYVIDSHTGGMPTRVILSGGPDLGVGSLGERAGVLAREYSDFCRGVLSPPFGQAAMVGALLVPPDDHSAQTGVVFFDAGAVLGMCGHGLIGLGVTLVQRGQVAPETSFTIDTPAGAVACWLKDKNTVTFRNIESFRFKKGVVVDLPEFGQVSGDLAYGGNWFFIAESAPLPLRADNIPALRACAIAIRAGLGSQGLCGVGGAVIDHIIFQEKSGCGWRNFVLCPDDDFDRSPCGTGSSAWLACLAADGRVQAGARVRQDSITGSCFVLSFQPGQSGHEGIYPVVEGQAFVTAQSRLFFAPDDPLAVGTVI